MIPSGPRGLPDEGRGGVGGVGVIQLNPQHQPGHQPPSTIRGGEHSSRYFGSAGAFHMSDGSGGLSPDGLVCHRSADELFAQVRACASSRPREGRTQRKTLHGQPTSADRCHLKDAG